MKASKEIFRLGKAVENADAVLIGAGAGLSAAAGYTYAGERFQKHFADFARKYHFGRLTPQNLQSRIAAIFFDKS